MDIGRRDISDVLSSLAELGPITQFTGRLDLFVCTLGFEDRAPALAERFAREGVLSNAVMILVEYPKNVSDNQANLIHFERASKKAFAFQSIRQRVRYGWIRWVVGKSFRRSGSAPDLETAGTTCCTV